MRENEKWENEKSAAVRFPVAAMAPVFTLPTSLSAARWSSRYQQHFYIQLPPGIKRLLGGLLGGVADLTTSHF